MSWIPAVVGAVGGIAGGIAGANALSDSEKRAIELIQQSISEYQSIGLPPEEALRVSLQESRQMGLLTPNLENVINQNPTEMLGVNTDPRLRDAQLAAMNEFRQVGESGGMRLSDIANYEKAMSDVAQRERGSREAILMDAAQRGASTGGGALAAQLLNQQAGGDQRHMDALNLAGRAQDVALQSIAKSGELGGYLRSQDYDEQAQKARAQDTINAMNSQAARGVQQRNIDALNNAQAANLAEAQRINDQNVNIRNQQTTYNANVPQQMFENAMNKQNSIANTRAGQAANTIQSGANSAKLWGGVGSAFGSAGLGVSDYLTRDKKDKKDV